MGSAKSVYILPRPDGERTCEKKVFGPCVLALEPQVTINDMTFSEE